MLDYHASAKELYYYIAGLEKSNIAGTNHL
jgi:hypothetical protein